MYLNQNLIYIEKIVVLITVPLNYNFISTCVDARGNMYVAFCVKYQRENPRYESWNFC